MITTLYVIKNSKGRYYIGVTENITRRLLEHNSERSLATRGRGPWELVYTEIFPSSQEAKRREYDIKQKKRKSYIDWLIAKRGSVV